MSFTFIHAADLHLDTPFSGLGQVAPHLQTALREASLETFDALIELTIAKEARFLLLGGDIYDGATRGIRAQIRFLRGLTRLSEHGIATFIVHGNHDPLTGWSAIRKWPEGVTIFDDEQIGKVTLTENGIPYATIYGTSFSTSHPDENLSKRFQRGNEPGLHIGLLHCNVGTCSDEHVNYHPCTLDDLKATQMDYWALGHIHQRAILCRDPWVVYPGNTQGRSPKSSELGPKGAMVVQVDSNRIQDVSFAPLDRIRFITLTRNIEGLADLASLTGSLLEEAERLQASQEGRPLILRATLTGRGPIAQELCLPGKLAELTDALRQESPERPGFIWWDEIKSQAIGVLDLETIRKQQDFAAELLKLNEVRKADSEQLQAFWEQQLEPLKVFKNLVPLISDSEQSEILKEAELLAIDLLSKE